MSVTPVFHGYISEEGTLSLLELEHGRRVAYYRTLAGQPVEIIVRRERTQRTEKQHRYYFGVVVPLVADFCGYEKDEMHNLLAMRFLRIDDDPITGSPRRRHTPDTDTKEFADYLDCCIRFASEHGVVIPEPHEVTTL